VHEPLILPVAGEASETLVTLISGGQPVALVDARGRPVAIVMDVDILDDAVAAS
jgi:hypothetical protein